MTSVITWLDVSADEQRRMRELAAMFTQRDSRDELGIGQLRDGISDALFPGTSTLHTRARYLLFVPWCFQYAAQSRSRVKGGTRQPDATELELIETLRFSPDADGLLGERAGRNLQTLPSSVYWSMLQRYGILTRPASRAEAFEASHPHVHVDDDGLTTSTSIWSAPPIPKRFPDEVGDGFALTSEEASWLRDRVLEHAPGTLLAHLVQQRPEDDRRAPWEDAVATRAPQRAARVLRHAQHFATIIHGAQLLYNLLLAEEADRAELLDDYRDRLARWPAELAAGYDEWRLDDLLSVLHEERGSRLPVAPAAQRFVQSWTTLVQRSDPGSIADLLEARAMIREREKIKGARTRLGNPRRLETWKGASGSALLTFRWATVRQFARDIHEGWLVLEPDSRSLLSELLRPPAGFHLSHAVGTSFTMTLEAALSIPLAFAGAVEVDDEVGILGAVRRATQRIDLFAQAGCLGLGTASELVTVLEPMVHPVRMPGSRLFHPKVWFLEFERAGERRYRFICSSRNLTNDRTWDAVVSLDGVPDEDLNAETVRSNQAMAAVLRWLIDDGRTAPALEPERAARIARLAEAWTGIRWEHPHHVRAIRVHTFGIGLPSSDAGPRLSGIRTAIVSPFVTDEGVRILRARPGGETTLLSRPEALDRLHPETLQELSLRVLDEMVDQALADAETSAVSAGELRGLHAKVVVHDHAHKQSTVLVGSANATGPAWSNNVEVMVEAEGPKSHLGVEAVLGSLAPLIEEYATTGGGESSQEEEADRRLENALREVARARLVLRVNAEGEYTVTAWAEAAPTADDRYTLSWRMLSQPEPIPGPLPTADDPYESPALRLEQITPFVVIALTDRDGRRRETLVVADLLDDVPGRGDAIVAAHLTEPTAVARFIRLMLQDGSLASIGTGGGGAFSSAFGAGVAESGAGLLELLVRASATNRSGLVDVERVLRHVPEDARGSALPPGFTEVWAAVTEAAGVER